MNQIKAFISYKWEDDAHNQWVERFARDLQQNGVKSFLDRWEVRLGDSFTDYMTEKIVTADIVLFIMTTQSVAAVENQNGQGGAIKFEIQLATTRRIAGEKMRLIPVYREGTKTAAHVQDHRYIDFRDDTKYSEKMRELVEDLIGKSKPPPLALAQSQDAQVESALVQSRLPGRSRGMQPLPTVAEIDRLIVAIKQKQAGLPPEEPLWRFGAKFRNHEVMVEGMRLEHELSELRKRRAALTS
jgi:hypothetical protein